MKKSISFDAIIWGLQRHGGISNYWQKITNFFNKSESFDSKVILPSLIKYSNFSNQSISNSKIFKESLSPSVARYCDVLSGADSDIFHTSYYRLPLFNNGKYVVTAYDFMYERYTKGPRLWLHSHQKARCLNKADVIICISDATRKDVTNFYPHISPSKLKTIYLGVDCKNFYPEPIGGPFDLSDVVLFVGQRNGYKRFDLALEALSSCNYLRLGIVGEKLTADELNSLNKYIPGRWVHFGAVSVERLRQLYSEVFAFIFPSDFEGFGLPVLEAMACGCPVVAASQGSIPEVGGGYVAYAHEQKLVNYVKCLNNLRESSEYRGTLISGGLTRANEFTWDATLNETFDVYSNLFS